jgi:hypothetical protein
VIHTKFILFYILVYFLFQILIGLFEKRRRRRRIVLFPFGLSMLTARGLDLYMSVYDLLAMMGIIFGLG